MYDCEDYENEETWQVGFHAQWYSANNKQDNNLLAGYRLHTTSDKEKTKCWIPCISITVWPQALFIVILWSSDILYIKYPWMNIFQWTFWSWTEFWCIKINDTRELFLVFYPVRKNYIFFVWNGRYNIFYTRNCLNSEHMVYNISRKLYFYPVDYELAFSLNSTLWPHLAQWNITGDLRFHTMNDCNALIKPAAPGHSTIIIVSSSAADTWGLVVEQTHHLKVVWLRPHHSHNVALLSKVLYLDCLMSSWFRIWIWRMLLWSHNHMQFTI